MTRPEQIALLKRLLHYLDTKTTCMAGASWCNDVSTYTDPDHAASERQLLFRERPLLMGFSSDWAGPGAFRTDDYAGVPIVIARAPGENCARSSTYAGTEAPRLPRAAGRPGYSSVPIMRGRMN
jgi:hypothetical protein